MSMEWMDKLLGNKIDKEAMDSQGTNAADHFDRKVKAHDWIKGVSELDEKQVEAEYLAAQVAEARALGKIAAHEFKSDEEVIKADYERQVKILSDYNLAEMLAEYRGQEENNLLEKFSELKEEAKKNVASGREKCETELLKLIGTHTHLDWQKKFADFSKDAKVEQPKEKDLYEPKAPEAEHKFDSPSEDKFKTPKDQDKAIPGNGREADERTDATKEAGVLQSDITEGLGKVAEKVKDSPADDKGNLALPEGKKSAGDASVESVEEPTAGASKETAGDKSDQAAEANSPEKGDKAKSDEAVQKEAHCGTCPGDPGVKEAVEVKAEGEACPVCGGPGEDLGSMGSKEHFRCQGCGITFSHDKGASCTACGSLETKSDLDTDGEWSAEEIAETFINGNISDAKEAIDGDMDMFVDVLSVLESSAPSSVDSFKRLMRGEGKKPKRTPSPEEQERSLGGFNRASLNTEIKSQASKEEVIKKIAEIQSPWIVQKLADGTEVIARVDQLTNTKESEEDKTEELQK